MVALVLFVLYVLVSPFSFLQMAGGEVNVIEVLAHIAAVGAGAAAIYKGTDLLGYFYWSFSGYEMAGRTKAALSLVLALVTTPVIYGLLLVDGGIIKYDYRGLLAVFGISLMTAWLVYQRSKYKIKAGPVIQTTDPPDPPF
jgi:hypothetical protein